MACFFLSSFLFLLLLFSAPVLAQTPDSPRDTLDLASDTSVVNRSGVDTVVVYTAKDSIVYSMRTRVMQLHGQSELKYRAIGLKAERVDVNWNTATLFAQGVPDTLAPSPRKIRGAPVLQDGGETYNGVKVSYNFRTKKGKIDLGDTEIEQGYYHGEAIKKVEQDVLFVAHGRYTTCDLDHPHYYFLSPKMKVIVRDHIVAEPIYFYIADVPIFALPFGVFPNKSGRRSGLIAPAYGEDARRGRFLSHFGYYWAMNDYMDAATTFDWYTRGGWINRSLFRYALRYHFTGSVNASVTSLHDGEPDDPGRSEQRDYSVQLTHNQQIDPTSRLDVNFTFASGTYYRNTSFRLDEILRQNIVSTATYSKTWQESNRSLTISAYRDQSLVTGDVQEQLPAVSFSQGQLFPFKRSSLGHTDAGSEQAWYELIGVSYNLQAQSNRTKTFTLIRSTTDPTIDSLKIEKRQQRLGANHQVGVSFSPKAGHFTIGPFFQYQELWYNQKTYRDQFGEREEEGFYAVRTFLTGVSASTRFFGIFQPQVLGITGIRHTVSPSLSFSYRPDFSAARFGYYGTYFDSTGREVKYSHFQNGIYGGAPAGLQQALSLNVGNLFEMKYATGDTAQPEKKIQLMNIGASISYNFAADSLRLSPLVVSYRTDIGNIVNLSAATTFDFYQYDQAARTRVNKFLLKERKYLADLTSVSFTVSTTLSGEKSSAGTPPTSTVQTNTIGGQSFPPNQDQLTGQGLDDSPDFSIPWNLNLSYTFSQSQFNPAEKLRSSSLQANLTFNLTENWRVTAGGNYDFARKEFAAPNISVYRDLHCWEMNFTWAPIGFYRYYRLEIRLKAPQLQDIKVTKQGSARGTYF
jgi:lipopolysaccharide assembly outer membrane protein LptD (OstA)